VAVTVTDHVLVHDRRQQPGRLGHLGVIDVDGFQ
jgi:hypothetical protein